MRADEIGESIKSYLGMASRPVGIKLHASAVNHQASLEGPLWYCQAIREAAKGRDILMRQGDEACKVAEIVLGFREPRRLQKKWGLQRSEACLGLLVRALVCFSTSGSLLTWPFPAFAAGKSHPCRIPGHPFWPTLSLSNPHCPPTRFT